MCYNAGMRTTVVVPPELQKKVKRLAAERGVSFGQLVREGLEAIVETHQPKPRAVGVMSSGHKDSGRWIGETRAVPRPWR
jgi:hypothetical protein